MNEGVEHDQVPTAIASPFETVTKLMVVALTLAAAAIFSGLLSRGWPWGRSVVAAAFLIPAIGALIAPPVAGALVLVCAYTIPALVALLAGVRHPIAQVLWIVMPLAIVVANGRHSRWHLPSLWKYPLAAWGLIAAVSGTIVMGREADFVPRLTFWINVPNTGIGGPPEQIVAWVASVVAIAGTGVLWFDWLFQRHVESGDRFVREVIRPLAISAFVATVVAFVQVIISPGFLNTGLYTYLRRASGTMLDANSYGVVAALWATVLAGLATGQRDETARWRSRLFAAGAATLTLGAWFSGSRSCLLILCSGAVVGFVYGIRKSQSTVRQSRPRFVVGVAVAAILIIAALEFPNVGPIHRLMETLPSSPGPLVRELWTRGAYGPAALLMIRDHPAAGVGVGAFHFLLHDYAKRATGLEVLPDNAQNWYRHELAEFGIVGSIAWMAWLLLLVSALIKRRKEILASPTAAALVAALGGFALASLVGVPGQNAAVSITFWTLTFWLVRTRRGAEVDEPAPWTRRLWPWLIVMALVGGHAAATAFAAVGSLRVPHRAAEGGWRYAYGWYNEEIAPDGTKFRWTKDRALAVIDAPAPWMYVTVAVAPPDAATHPVSVKVWCDGTTIIDEAVSTPAPVRAALSIPAGRKRVVLETRTDRLWRPSDSGSTDRRALGLSVAWTFGATPPTGGSTPIVRLH